jgi:flagellar protein FliS
MNRTKAELNYLRNAAQSATQVGLVILLFDLLITDLQRAIAALQAGDVEKRSAEIKHAFLVLQQLEGSLNMEDGGDAAKHFARFYSFIRSKTLEAQIKMSRAILKEQIELLLSVRQAWQQVDAPSQGASPASTAPTGSSANGQRKKAAAAAAGSTANWTA